jgi:hypothetical protein
MSKASEQSPGSYARRALSKLGRAGACFAIAATLLGAGGCDKLFKKRSSRSDDAAKDDDGERSHSRSSKSVKGDDDDDDSGRFIYKVEPSHDPKYKRDEPMFTSGRLEGIVDAMKVFELPRNVPVLATDAGPCHDNVNAFYKPDKHAVYLCFAFVDSFYEAFKAAGKDDREASVSALNALTFCTFHEMGHALINELDLGVTGKEEDAVDELAALILIDNKKPNWAIDGTTAMTLLTAKSDTTKPAFFDEHSLSPQRLGDIMCMVYGSDPKKYADMEQDKELAPRLPKCEKFFDQKDKAWTTMLEPHYRKG